MSGFDEESIDLMVSLALRNTYVSVPCKVIKYSADTQEVVVKPLIRRKLPYHSEEQELPEVTQVPVQFPSADGGNMFMSFPIKKDDIGMLLFMDSDSDNYMVSDGSKVVNSDSFSNHDLNDAFFIPGVRPEKNRLKQVSANNIQIHNNNMNIEISTDGIKLQNPQIELVDAILQLMTSLETALVSTSLGPQPLSTKAQITELKTKLETMKL